MRIALISFNQPERGTWFRAYAFGRELARRGHTVTLMATDPHSRSCFNLELREQQRLALVNAPDLLPGSLRSGWDPWAGAARSAWLTAANYDLIHAFDCRPTAILPALIAARRADVPLVIDWSDWFGRGGSVEERPPGAARTLLRPIETFFEERFRSAAAATTAINRVLADKARELGVPAHTIHVLRNGCDPTASGPVEAPEIVRRQLDLPGDAPLIGYVGSIFARDSHLLAEAFMQLRAVRPDARLILVGYVNIAIEELLDTPEAIIRTGPTDDATLRRYLRACNLAWAPLTDSGANRGRWPLKLSTYMELGLPFVTSAIGDLGPFLAEYPAGLAITPTAAGYAEISLRLLNDPAQAAILGATGKRLAAGELSWASMTDQLERIYLDVLQQR
ncbi:MAG: glycosyltransferase family 4 protein [Oscillochloris sp.]|nr:glycosyltransferase family 4 protein [Oscillochloris sp.]